MFAKSLSSAALAATLVVSPISKASADTGNFIAGAVVGSVVGHAARREYDLTRTQRQTTTRTQSTARHTIIPSTRQGHDIQTSLNYFGFDAGSVDGQLGGQSRAAISRYQAYMGYPATGQLTPLEEEILIASHRKGQVGSFETNRQIATHPDGERVLLQNYRQDLAGETTEGLPTTTSVALPNLGEAFAPTGVPHFQAAQSLAAHCNSVSLVTTTNGGYTTAESMTDPDLVLNEQFCLARSDAIDKYLLLAAQVQGVNPDQIVLQCQGLAPTMATYVSELHTAPQNQVVQSLQGFVATLDMSNEDLVLTGKICLGVGYQMDNTDVALGSALLLVGAGEDPYAELVGHHLMRGFGVAPSQLLASDWFDSAFVAVSSGSEPAFDPGDPGRTYLLRQAIARMN